LSLYLVLPLIELSFCLALLGILFSQGRQHVAKKPFALFLVFMAFWGVFIFLMRYAPTLSQAAFWENFVFISILCSSLAFYWFTIRLTGTKPVKRIVIPLLALCLITVGLLPTGLIFQGMQSFWYGKAPIIGYLFPLFVLCVYAPIALGMIALRKNSRLSHNSDEKIRNQYIFAGIIALFIGGTTDYLPALGLSVYPLGIIGNIFFCLLTTIAMLKYGLMEIKVVLRTGAVYSLISILILGIFGSLTLIITTTFQDKITPLSMASTIAAVFLIAAIFQPLLSSLQSFVDRLCFRQRYDHLQALKKLARDKDSNLNLEQVSASLVTNVAHGLQSSGVYLLLPSPLTQDFTTQAYSGQLESSSISFSASSSLAVTMKYQDGIVDCGDIDVIPALTSLTKKDRQVLRAHYIDLIMTLKNEERFIGMLLLSRKISGEPYSNEDKRLLQSVAAAVAVRIDSACRYEVMARANTELQRTMDGVISAISVVVESRDPYTAGHQRRVAELARAIATEMGFPEYQVKGMHIMGLLHDVGKISVPAEILSKPGKISQYEFNIIKNHSQTGFEILEKVNFPWPVAKAILQHHERLNGSGYPHQLSNGDIIIEARILGVADVVEAMSSHRPYRPALGLDAALKEIQQNSGILYDPLVVNACLRLLQDRRFTFDKLMSAADSSPQAVIV
jgi:putative nucleotidyltransferase with HDIG domain